MKKVLVLAAALMVSGSAFAASDDLCKDNLQKLREDRVSTGQIGQPLLDQIRKARMQAEAAQKAGKIDDCIALTNKALMGVDKASKGE